MRETTRRNMLFVVLVSAFLTSESGTGFAQSVAVPNSSFESGTDHPDGWTLSGGTGAWLAEGAADGQRAISVIGAGEDSSFWRCEPLPIEAGVLYRLGFRARGIDGQGGTPISGPSFCNRDLGQLPNVWTPITSYFVAPADMPPEDGWLRFGQWHVKGTVAFDAVELTPAQAIYRGVGGILLGDGERVEGNTYTFEARWGTAMSNHSRTLSQYRAVFNTDRWNLGPDSQLVFKHAVGDRLQQSGSLEVSVTNYGGGELAVDACADGFTWHDVGLLDGNGVKTFALPAALFPYSEIWVRMTARAKEASGANPTPPACTVSGYRYSSQFDGPPVSLTGATHYAGITATDPRLIVTIESLGDGLPGGDNKAVLRVTNTTRGAIDTTPTLTVRPARGAPTEFRTAFRLLSGEQLVPLSYDVPDAGAWMLEFSLGEGIAFRADAPVLVPELYKSGYGERLPGSSAAVGLWWASSGWKISRTRPVPAAAGPAVSIRTARNEAEAAQLVVRPQEELRGFTARAGELTGPGGATIGPENVAILRVRYVNITLPTDASGAAAWWPDPLPPLTEPATLGARANQPLWVRIKAPRGIPAGTYSGTIHLTAENYAVDVPLQVEVYDFDLPDRMTCTTAFSFSVENVFQYQKLSDPAQQRAVLEKYWANFSAHHVSPYDPAPLDPVGVTWPAADAAVKPEDLKPVLDWTAWDAAMDRAMNHYHFNTFVLSAPGMGSGTFHSRIEPELRGFKESTPEYQALFRSYYQQVQEHLRAKGWLDAAYVYWFDEPDPKDYDFVMNGFRKLKEAAPDIHRMLTEQVEPALAGGPDIWCPITPEYNHEAAEQRRVFGERFWWYVCTGPKAPYCTLFIDHPATELRVWLWQTWQRKIDGILIWHTNYWTSPTAYTDPRRPQNPYLDPMSWTAGYGTPDGARLPWGNGDGRFIYPPEAAADGRQPGPVLEGPVDSIRWEMLRDGIEDYEYLTLLKQRLEAGGTALTENERAELTALLTVPESITANMTTFTKEPAPIEARRDAVARAITRLNLR